MINENEVRSGNVFIDAQTGKEVTLTFQITHQTAGFLTLELAKNFADLRPIPITEEWLLKFGFGKTENKNIFIKGLFDFIFWGEGEFNEFIIGDRSIKIQYIHQLQNLYFALMRKELTIKESASSE